MKRHLTKIKVDANQHSYVNNTNPTTVYGQRSACVFQFDDTAWAVEYRHGARFVARRRYATAREAVAAAKDGHQVAQTITGAGGWHNAMAGLLYDAPCGAVDALQAYLDRCHRRGLRPNLDKFINAGGLYQVDVRCDIDADPYLDKPLNFAAA